VLTDAFIKGKWSASRDLFRIARHRRRDQAEITRRSRRSTSGGTLRDD